MRPTIYNFILLLSFNCLPLISQQGADVLFKRLQMNEAFNPPQDILSAKSIVLIDVPKGLLQDERIKVADRVQLFFAETGIDAVMYYGVPAFNSLSGMVEQIPSALLKRDIKNLIFLSVLEPEKDFVLGMGPFNEGSNFYDEGSTFWVRRTTDLELVFDELRLLFKTGAFLRTNLLVSNTAEFFEPVVSGFRQAYATLPREFEGKKIAIPLIDENPLSAPSALKFSPTALMEPNELVKVEKERKLRMEGLTKSDSILFEVVNVTNKNDTELRRAGFDYVLHYIAAEAPNVYRFLPFKGRKEDQTGVLYKFFLRDVRSNNAYLGESWDASLNWNEALNSFIAQIDQVKAKKGN